MTKEEMFTKLREIAKTCDYTDEFDFHVMQYLLKYIGDAEVDNFITTQYKLIIRNRQDRQRERISNENRR